MTHRFKPQDLSAQGKHDFDRITFSPGSFSTISIGVFPWVLSSSGKFLKKGKSKVRVIGDSAQVEKIHEKALEIARELDAGTYAGPKNVKVK